MKAALITIRPLNPITNARLDIYIGEGTAEDLGSGGRPFGYEPAIVGSIEQSIELFSPDLDGKIQVGTMRFRVLLSAITAVAEPEKLYWDGAPIVMVDDIGINNFTGYIDDADFDNDGHISFSAVVSTKLLDKPLLTATFDGGGGIGGDPGIRGTFLPAGFGKVPNIEPVWFDQTYNIGMIDGYGNLLSVEWLGEGLSSMGPAVADYPTYAALKAAIVAKTVLPGRWATCIAQGLIGLGAPADGRITCHATFGFNTIGAMCRRVLSAHAGIPAPQIDTAAFDAVDAALFGLLPNHGLVHYWTNGQRNIQDLLQALTRSCNASLLATFQGVISITRATFTTPRGVFDLTGGQTPRVLSVKLASGEPPVYLMSARAARPATVLSTSEVNYVDTFVDRGLYNPTTAYRQGNIVSLSNSSEWLYINPIASAGHAPPFGLIGPDLYWQQLRPAQTYNDGVPIEDLRPRDGGSTRNDDGGNKISSPVMLDRVVLSGGATRQVTGSSGRNAEKYRILLAAANAKVIWESSIMSVTPGQTMYYQHFVQADSATPDTCVAGYETYGADAVMIGSYQIEGTSAVGSDVTGAFVARQGTFVVPNGVAGVRVYAARLASTNAAVFRVGEPYFGSSQPGADVTSANQATLSDVPDITIAADYQGNVNQGELPFSFSVRRYLGAVDVSPQTNFTVSAPGGASVSVNNTVGSDQRGTVTLAAPLNTNSDTIIVTTTYQGGTPLLKSVKVTKALAAAPVAGGGGGGGGAPGGASTTSGPFTAPGTGGYTTLATLQAVTVGSSGAVKLATSLSFNQQDSAGEGSETDLVLKWAASVNGGPFTDITTIQGSYPAQKYFSTQPPKGTRTIQGSHQSSYTHTGLTSGASVIYRAQTIANPQTYGATGISGTISATPQ